jgi:hypothetical protein
VPRESFDPPEHLPKESRRQVAFGQLQEEASGVSDEAPVGLEQPLLEARQRPALDGGRQDKPTQEIAEVVGDDAQERPDLVGPEPMTGKAGPVGSGLTLLDPLLTDQWWVRSSTGTWVALRHERVMPNDDGSITLLLVKT